MCGARRHLGNSTLVHCIAVYAAAQIMFRPTSSYAVHLQAMGPGMHRCAQPLRRADVVRDLRVVVQEVHRAVVERVVRRHRLCGGGRRELRLPVAGHLEALRRDHAWQRGRQGVSSAALGRDSLHSHGRVHAQLAQRRAPHSPRESVMQYGVLRLVMAGQVSVPGPYAGLLNASLVPGCAPPRHTQVMPCPLACAVLTAACERAHVRLASSCSATGDAAGVCKSAH